LVDLGVEPVVESVHRSGVAIAPEVREILEQHRDTIIRYFLEAIGVRQPRPLLLASLRAWIAMVVPVAMNGADGAGPTWVHTDTIDRGDTSLEKLARLKPAFARDGVDPGDQLLIGPALAIPKVLDETGRALADIDYVDMHETFAAQVLSVLKVLGSASFARERLGRTRAVGTVDPARVNVRGGSLRTPLRSHRSTHGHHDGRRAARDRQGHRAPRHLRPRRARRRRPARERLVGLIGSRRAKHSLRIKRVTPSFPRGSSHARSADALSPQSVRGRR
jgi:hypothetical protein